MGILALGASNNTGCDVGERRNRDLCSSLNLPVEIELLVSVAIFPSAKLIQFAPRVCVMSRSPLLDLLLLDFAWDGVEEGAEPMVGHMSGVFCHGFSTRDR